MNCPACETKIPDGDTTCPDCGASPEQVRELILRARAAGWTVGLLAGVAVAFAFLAYFGDSAFFYSVWIVPPGLGWIFGEIFKSYRLEHRTA